MKKNGGWSPKVNRYNQKSYMIPDDHCDIDDILLYIKKTKHKDQVEIKKKLKLFPNLLKQCDTIGYQLEKEGIDYPLAIGSNVCEKKTWEKVKKYRKFYKQFLSLEKELDKLGYVSMQYIDNQV
jgi:hypothetical protein